MTWIFSLLAIVGIFVQVFNEIFGDRIPDRLYEVKYYFLFFILGLAAMICTLRILASFGKWIARRSWFPMVLEGQKELFYQAVCIEENNGLREDQLAGEKSFSNIEQCKKANFDTAEKHVLQIEKLLDLPTGYGSIQERIERLRPYFRKDS